MSSGRNEASFVKAGRRHLLLGMGREGGDAEGGTWDLGRYYISCQRRLFSRA